MKTLLLLALLSLSAHAELPYVVGDSKSQDNMVYIDSKINSIKTDVETLKGSSTSGVIDIAHGGTAATTATAARASLSVPSNTGTGASGTWAISVTGSAATATDASKVAKTGDTMTGALSAPSASFTLATATNTFSGYIDMGLTMVYNECGAGVASCIATCPAGKYAISGGCHNLNKPLRASFFLSNTQWYCGLVSPDTDTMTAYALCARVAADTSW